MPSAIRRNKPSRAEGDFGHPLVMTARSVGASRSSAIVAPRQSAGSIKRVHAMLSMQSLFRSAALAAALSLSAAAFADGQLSIDVTDIETVGGTLKVKLVDSAEAYADKAPPIAGRDVVVAEKGTLKVSFDGLKPGTYAVMIMHDENDNGALDSNMLGIPKEGYGFSNNPRVMRQPTFDEAKFEVKDGTNTITIQII
jgi:uncharacterized protein (DUF2141 family)